MKIKPEFVVKKIKPKVKIDETITLGDLIKVHPETKDVLSKHFGQCIKCPGSGLESIEFISQMVGKDQKKVLAEIKELFYEE